MTIMAPTPSSDSSTEAVDEKSHTFRRRRLSLANKTSSLDDTPTTTGSSLLGQVAKAAAPKLTAAPGEQNTSGPPGMPNLSFKLNPFANSNRKQQQQDAEKAVESALNAVDEDEKSHTFRKRRLSLTKLSPAAAAALNDNSDRTASASPAANWSVSGSPAGSMGSAAGGTPNASPSPVQHLTKRPRLSSDASVASSGKKKAFFPSKTHHSAELVGHAGRLTPPPSPAVLEDSILYQARCAPPPFLLSPAGGQQQQHYPRWKRRQVVKDETKLPFPKEIVGTYSCHGMEPVYEEEYYEEDDDDEGWDQEDAVPPNPMYQQQFLAAKGLAAAVEQVVNQQEKEGPPADTGEATATPVAVEELNPTTEQAAEDRNPTEDAGAEEERPSKSEVSEEAQQPTETSEQVAPPSAEQLQPTTATTAEEEEAWMQQQLIFQQQQQQPRAPRTVAKINQDRGGIAFPYGNCPRTALFAVYDGHGQGGELVSQFALTEIQRRLEKHQSFPTDLSKCFVDTFLQVDEALKQEPMIEPLYAGTTACVALLCKGTLTCANAGDSRAVMARRRKVEQQEDQWEAISLTQDQNPDLPEEASRIMGLGGYVSASPAPGLSARVWLDPQCTEIGLAMSRSIGDHAVSEIGVIAEPVVTTHTVTQDDDFLILASDGVWEFLSSDDAVQIVSDRLYGEGGDSVGSATKACQALIEAAANRWHEEEGEYRDDITAIVIRMQELWRNESNTRTEASKEAK